MHVKITQVDEAKNNLILSEREAWVSTKICLFFFLLSSFSSQCERFWFVLSFLSFETPAV